MTCLLTPVIIRGSFAEILMPIYEYRCSACGFQDDFLQKISDPPLTECPECHETTFAKQVTAAGFQLKGSGWYATDFRNGGKSNSGGKGGAAASPPSEGGSGETAKGDSGKSDPPKSEAAACGAGACPACN